MLISLLVRDSTQRAHLIAAGVTPLVAAAALCPEAGQTQLQQHIKVGRASSHVPCFVAWVRLRIRSLPLSLLLSLTCRAYLCRSCHLGHACPPLQQHSIDACSMGSANDPAVLQAFAQSADAEDFEMRCLSWHLLAQLMQCRDAVEPGIAVHFVRQVTARPADTLLQAAHPAWFIAVRCRPSHVPRSYVHACAAPQHCCCRFLHSFFTLGTPGELKAPTSVVP